jgi:hypothetical protein
VYEVFYQFDDHGAIRCAVADILIAISYGKCSDERTKEIRTILEKAVDVVHRNIEEIKA